MLVREAKEIARRWVVREASSAPSFEGAFFHGSTTWLADDATLPATSDVDLVVVHGSVPPDAPRGKRRVEGLLLDVAHLPSADFASSDAVLGRYELAGSFRTPQVILDPTGRLGEVQRGVARDYSKRSRVRERCEQAREKGLRYLRSLEASMPFPEQVLRWLFGTGSTTHVLLVAGLRNPTVRERYAAARSLLAEYGYTDFPERLLEILGCAQMEGRQAEHHLLGLAEAFDAAASAIVTPFPFAADLSAPARRVSIDGSRALIESGLHREAVFWLAVTAARCQAVFEIDAPALCERFEPGYRELLADLGIHSPADLAERVAGAEESLSPAWDVAEEIIARNAAVED